MLREIQSPNERSQSINDGPCSGRLTMKASTQVVGADLHHMRRCISTPEGQRNRAANSQHNKSSRVRVGNGSFGRTSDRMKAGLSLRANRPSRVGTGETPCRPFWTRRVNERLKRMLSYTLPVSANAAHGSQGCSFYNRRRPLPDGDCRELQMRSRY